jgi:hypothetical protein
MNAQRRGGIYLVPSHPDQDDVDYFARVWKELSQLETALSPPTLASGAIRASSLTPGSLQALVGFAVGSTKYEPGDVVNCDEPPSLAEALVRLGYVSRMPCAFGAANRAGVSQARVASKTETLKTKDRLKKALADLAMHGGVFHRQKRWTT